MNDDVMLKSKMRTINAFLIFFYLTPSVKSQAYDDCVRHANNSVVCANLGWTSLPPKIPEETVELIISGNNITELDPAVLNSSTVLALRLLRNNIRSLTDEQFVNMPNLRILTITNNSIEVLPNNLFKSNTEIILLELSYNNIKEISADTFEPLPNLIGLMMGNNKITSIPNFFLRNQRSLIYLTLNHNMIEKIDENAFEGAPRIKSVSLSHNKISQLPTRLFEQIPAVSIFDISYNRMKTFPWKEYIEKSRREMIHLFIRYNNIEKIPKSFLRVVHLSQFEFGGNPLHCDCDLDWVRAKEWIGINPHKSGTDNYFLVYSSSYQDKKTIICAGPGIYTNRYPWEFDTLCDVDECVTMEMPCKPNANCINTAGGYKCICREGFYGYGKISCNDLDECMLGIPGLRGTACSDNAICKNEIGSYTCKCKPGYRGDGQVCQDINECREVDGNCPSQASCINTPGGYRCKCSAGYVFSGHNCIDINECEGNHGCEKKCINTIGSYRCNCEAGFRYEDGDGLCYDIDECLGAHNCDKNAKCTNQIGSYTCHCLNGYMGDGYKCEDIDECYLDLCHHNATCLNTGGGYKCQCNPGYYGDGKKCLSTSVILGRFENRRAEASSGAYSTVLVILVVLIVCLVTAGGAYYAYLKKPELIFCSKGDNNTHPHYGERQKKTGEDPEALPQTQQ